MTPSQPSSCDLDPIHLIGSIQPHGAMIAARTDNLSITAATANTLNVLGLVPETLLTKRLDDVIAQDDVRALCSDAYLPGPQRLLKPRTITFTTGLRPGAVTCIPHRLDGHVLLEILHQSDTDDRTWEEDELRRQIIADLVRPTTLAELAALSADIVRRVNGFDRVMIYRFAEDNHGEVIAESTDRADSYLGLHYPASDIPEPARRHFARNVVRTIGHVDAAPVPVLGQPGLDLTHSILRAVPQTHLEYLRNMGVAASMSVSLVANDRLWGLIASHHYAPRRVSLRTLRFAELLAGTISALLQGIENRTQLSRSIESEKIAFAMEKQGRAGAPLSTVVRDWAPQLMGLLGAQGLILRKDGETDAYGQVPEKRLRYAPLRQRLTEGVTATDHLAATLTLDTEQAEKAAGAGYMELSGDGADYLVLLRQHYEHTVKWAGKPETLETKLADGQTRLNPRKSFAVWREERVGRSRPFDTTDREALRIVRRALFALNSLEREQAAIAARKAAEAHEERLRLALMDAARQTSMGELASALAHELNQPLAAVSNYVNACRQQLRNCDATLPADFEEMMQDAVAEASRAADLVRRLRDFISGGALQLEEIDLHAAIHQGVDLARLAAGSDRPQLHLDLAPDMPAVWGDAIQIGQVVLNLANNAIAAMRGQQTRTLTIQTRAATRTARVTIADNGPGIADDQRPTLFEPFHSSTTSGMGIGLSLCRSIVEAHGGTIAAEFPEQGARIAFTVPLARQT